MCLPLSPCPSARVVLGCRAEAGRIAVGRVNDSDGSDRSDAAQAGRVTSTLVEFIHEGGDLQACLQRCGSCGCRGDSDKFSCGFCWSLVHIPLPPEQKGWSPPWCIILHKHVARINFKVVLLKMRFLSFSFPSMWPWKDFYGDSACLRSRRADRCHECVHFERVLRLSVKISIFLSVLMSMNGLFWGGGWGGLSTVGDGLEVFL